VSDTETIKWLIERNVFEDQNPPRAAHAARSRGMACIEVAFECVNGDERGAMGATVYRSLIEAAIFVRPLPLLGLGRKNSFESRSA